MMPVSFPRFHLPWAKSTDARARLPTRGVNDSGLESAPEYEFASFLAILDGDSGSGSFLVWSRFQPGIGSTSEGWHKISLLKTKYT